MLSDLEAFPNTTFVRETTVVILIAEHHLSQLLHADILAYVPDCRFFQADIERRGKLNKGEVEDCLKKQGTPSEPLH